MSLHDMSAPSLTAAVSVLMLCSIVALELIGESAALQAKKGTDPEFFEVRRAPKPEFDASKGTTKYELLYQRTNKETGEHTSFSYQSERNNDHVVWLDDDDSVLEVDCGSEEVLILKVADSCSLLLGMKDWQLEDGQGFLVYGGLHWGCPGPNKGRSPLFRVMTGPRSASRIDSANFTLSIPTGVASPFAFFGRSRFSFSSNESLLDMGGLRRTLNELSNAHFETKEKRQDPSHRRATYGQFPSSPSEWGLGKSIDLINWNYDLKTRRAREENICFFGSENEFDSNGLRSCCRDCYIYAGMGFGFEFETEAFNHFPTYVYYIKLWVGATATYNVNLDLEAQGVANSPFESGSGVNNLLTQTNQRDVPFREARFTGQEVDNLLDRDFQLTVGKIGININFKMPVFLQWGINTTSAGRAWVGSHYRARDVYGIAYLNQDKVASGVLCQMSGCKDLVAAGCSTEWCVLHESAYEKGSSGPYWTFTGPVTAQIALTPIFMMLVWDGAATASFQLDAIGKVTGFVKPVYTGRSNVDHASNEYAATARVREHEMLRYSALDSDICESYAPCPAGQYRSECRCISLASSSCLEVSVSGSISAYAWAVLNLGAVVFGSTSEAFTWRSGLVTIVENLGPWELLSPTCISLADIQDGKPPMMASRDISPAEDTFLRLGPTAALSFGSGALQAALTIVAVLVTDEPSVGVVQGVMNTDESTTYALQSRILQLEPHGTSFNSDIVISLEVDISSWDQNTTTAVDFCGTLALISKADASSPWTASPSTLLNCSALPTVSIPSRSFSYYAVSAAGSTLSSSSSSASVSTSSAAGSALSSSSSSASVSTSSQPLSTSSPSPSSAISTSSAASSTSSSSTIGRPISESSSTVMVADTGPSLTAAASTAPTSTSTTPEPTTTSIVTAEQVTTSSIEAADATTSPQATFLSTHADPTTASLSSSSLPFAPSTTFPDPDSISSTASDIATMPASTASAYIPTTTPTPVQSGMDYTVEMTVAIAGNVSDFDESAFMEAVAQAAQVEASRVVVNDVRALDEARRAGQRIAVDFSIGYPTMETAQIGAAAMTEQNLNQAFASGGLPPISVVSPPSVIQPAVPETTLPAKLPREQTLESGDDDDDTPVALIVGLTCGIGGFFLIGALFAWNLKSAANSKMLESGKEEPAVVQVGEAEAPTGDIITVNPAFSTNATPHWAPPPIVPSTQSPFQTQNQPVWYAPSTVASTQSPFQTQNQPAGNAQIFPFSGQPRRSSVGPFRPAASPGPFFPDPFSQLPPPGFHQAWNGMPVVLSQPPQAQVQVPWMNGAQLWSA